MDYKGGAEQRAAALWMHKCKDLFIYSVGSFKISSWDLKMQLETVNNNIYTHKNPVGISQTATVV